MEFEVTITDDRGNDYYFATLFSKEQVKQRLRVDDLDGIFVTKIGLSGRVFPCHETLEVFEDFLYVVESLHSEAQVLAFLELHSRDLSLIDYIAFYADAEDYLFSELAHNDRVFQASNGIIVERFD